MKKILLYLWQLPQNIVGLCVIRFSHACRAQTYEDMYVTLHNFGVSLGKYIVLYHGCSLMDIKHEQGHQKQSLYLGWLYLFTIGILSAAGNLIDRVVHKDHRKGCWYYKQPWEAWADKLGGVKRW